MGNKGPKWDYLEGGWLRSLWLAVLLQAIEDALHPIQLDYPCSKECRHGWSQRQRDKMSALAYITDRCGSFNFACLCADVEPATIIKNFRLLSESHPTHKKYKRWERSSRHRRVVRGSFTPDDLEVILEESVYEAEVVGLR